MEAIQSMHQFKLEEKEIAGKSKEDISLQCCESCYFESEGGRACDDCEPNTYWQLDQW